MKTALATLLILLLIGAIIMGLVTAIIVGFGVILARRLPLSVFQASALVIGSTVTFAALIHIMATIINSQRVHEFGDEDDEDLSSDFADIPGSFQKPDFSKVGRNDYYPCGSGKKFKNCCEIIAVK